MPEIYEGPVRVFTADKNKVPYTIKNGKRTGQNYCRVSFDHNGQKLYLPDFSNESALYDGQVCKVAFSVRVDDFGEPELYNGEQQYNLDAIKTLAPAPETVHSQAATPQQGGSSQEHTDVAIRKAVAAKCASDLLSSRSLFDPSEWTLVAAHIDAWLAGKVTEDTNEFDAHMAAAERDLDATIEFEEGPPA